MLSIRRQSANFDYNVFWRQAIADRIVVKATAFAIDRADEKRRQFQNVLRGIGFEVKLKPYISRADGTSKGDWDVGITIDILPDSPPLQGRGARHQSNIS
jgi:uncharacterized LabA/DUF88 family protein